MYLGHFYFSVSFLSFIYKCLRFIDLHALYIQGFFSSLCCILLFICLSALGYSILARNVLYDYILYIETESLEKQMFWKFVHSIAIDTRIL